MGPGPGERGAVEFKGYSVGDVEEVQWLVIVPFVVGV